MLRVLTIFVGFFSIFGRFDTPPYIFDFCPVLYIWLFLEEYVGGGELSYLILTIFASQSWARHPLFSSRFALRSIFTHGLLLLNLQKFACEHWKKKI